MTHATKKIHTQTVVKSLQVKAVENFAQNSNKTSENNSVEITVQVLLNPQPQYKK